MARAKSPVILLSGFEPFGGDRINPSAEIVTALADRTVAGHTVRGLVLPCEFGRSRRQLLQAVRRERPALVVCLGLAAGRTAITPERVAINVDDARIPDNAGRQPVDRPVVRGAPAAYWSTLPVKAMVARLRGAGIPAELSQTAGTFVCNHVFFSLMHSLAARRQPPRGGFVHVPCLPAQAKSGQFSLPLAEQVRAVTLLLEAAITHRRDRRLAGGAEH